MELIQYLFILGLGGIGLNYLGVQCAKRGMVITWLLILGLLSLLWAYTIELNAQAQADPNLTDGEKDIYYGLSYLYMIFMIIQVVAGIWSFKNYF